MRLPRAPDVSSRVDPGIGGDDSVVIGGLPRGAFRLAATLAVQHARVACLLAVDRVPRVDVLGLRQVVERCRAVRCLTAHNPCGCPHVEIPEQHVWMPVAGRLHEVQRLSGLVLRRVELLPAPVFESVPCDERHARPSVSSAPLLRPRRSAALARSVQLAPAANGAGRPGNGRTPCPDRML